jgi:hypothetical protein
MTTLRETAVAHMPRLPRKKASTAVLAMFADHAIAARLWCAVAVAAVGFCVVQPILLVRAYRTEERVVVLDPSGTFHVSPLLAFENATKLHEEHALLACLALLQRNPAGADFPELLEKLFLPEALEMARAELAKSSEEFSAKALRQKPEIRKVAVLETKENVVLVEAAGQLIRTGVFGGKAFTEAPEFTLRLTLARNPNLAANGRFPLAVWSYELSQ